MKRVSESLGAVSPQSYEDLRAVLASGSIKLPKRLRDVAVFVCQHPDEVALGSSTSISEKAGVLPSTLVRFAQVLGYSGFSDMQELFKNHIKDAHPTTPKQVGGDGPGGLVGGFIEAAQAALARASRELDTERFERVATILAGADILYLLGSKRAYPITAYLSTALVRLGIRNILVDNVGSSAFDQISGCTPSDVILAVSFSPYNSITSDVAAAAAQSGAKLVCITDSALSPVIPYSSDWIEVVDNDFAGFRSPAATMTIATALMLSVARHRETRRGYGQDT